MNLTTVFHFVLAISQHYLCYFTISTNYQRCFLLFILCARVCGLIVTETRLVNIYYYWNFLVVFFLPLILLKNSNIINCSFESNEEKDWTKERLHCLNMSTWKYIVSGIMQQKRMLILYGKRKKKYWNYQFRFAYDLKTVKNRSVLLSLTFYLSFNNWAGARLRGRTIFITNEPWFGSVF